MTKAKGLTNFLEGPNPNSIGRAGGELFYEALHYLFGVI
jgi:hypothetical protein